MPPASMFSAGVGQGAEIKDLRAIECKGLHVFVRGDPVERGEEAVDLLGPSGRETSFRSRSSIPLSTSRGMNSIP